MADYEDHPYIVIERRSGGIVPFLWGALIGAGFAFLYAPRSGEETRRELRTAGLRMRSGVEDTMREVQGTITGTVDDVRREIEGRMDTARDAMDAGREAARETRRELERRIRDGVARAEARAADIGVERTEEGGPEA